MIKEYNFDEFNLASKKDWMDKLNQDLGAEVTKRITRWSCERELSLSAYYDQSDTSPHLDFSAPCKSSWSYLQPLRTDTTSAQALDALMNGADGLILGDAQIDKLDKVLDQVAPQHCMLGVRTSVVGNYEKFTDWWKGKHPKDGGGKVLLFADSQEISSVIDSRHLSFLDKAYEQGNQLGHRTITIDSGIVQRSGGSVSLELAYMLAQSVYYINRFLDKGCKIEKIIESLFISTSVGSSYFLELSKIRAIRGLMSQLFNHYGVSDRTVVIHASTSPITKSILDSNTNFLRCTSEAMSAILGGIDYLSIHPYHDLPASDRIARNISNLLKDESYLSKVDDAAAGSYYIDNLTGEVAKQAWDKFQQIEVNGGFEVSMKENYFQHETKKDLDFQRSRIYSGYRKMIGVNDFGNSDEKIKVEQLDQSHLALSNEFERVRSRIELFVSKQGESQRPAVYLLPVGTNSKMINARYTFATNFFNWAGLSIKKMDGKETLTEKNVLVCCGADDDYTDANIQLAMEGLESEGVLLAAGRESSGSSNKISTWVNTKSNRLETVDNIITQMGITQKSPLS